MILNVDGGSLPSPHNALTGVIELQPKSYKTKSDIQH
jgi:hypothetical protein